MKTVYRVIFTSLHDTAAERDKAYDSLKAKIADTVSKSAIISRADLTKDEYLSAENPVTEKVV